MTLTEHIVLGGAAATVLWPALGTEGSAVFWAASVLLDVDHYWDYLLRNGFRNWSVRQMFAFHYALSSQLHRPDLLAISLFHTVEWLVLVAAIGWWGGGGLVFAALAGMVFHLGLDLLRLATLRGVTRRALSIVEYAIRRRALRRRGLDPDAVYQEALMAIGVLSADAVVSATRRKSPRRVERRPAAGLPSFTVVVPALNEEENLRPAVEAILKEIGPLSSELEVLVFDDASTDGTGAVADELAAHDDRVRAFHNARRLNIGGIYKAALARARGECFFLVPGDNETRVDEIARGSQYLDRADVVVFHVTNPRVRSSDRRLLSGLYVAFVNVLFGTRFRYTNGTNIFRTEVLRRFPIRTDGFSYQTEAVVKAVRSGVDWVQVGMEIQARSAGSSKALTPRNAWLVAVALGRLWWDVNVVDRRRYRQRGRLVGAL